MSRLSKVRQLRGLKGIELARLAGVHATWLSSIEHRRVVPNAATRNRLAEILEEPETKLFCANGLAK
jgi:transcriptional regulator with XRE-family HTH domain